ncbi:rRNA maturation RNase YbeY [Echinicola jeungdonensis]|uniref:Endoribonuclease YbeY n=1 Tax=Echinicola jeungdonensis TaxID=709343 RepID=A0ABV5J7E1_9BACT|nr:rRNA maturation RNase YbeY [Echinicola jeungdonensis]MDN3669094.1 rRNA maturation RNase YbeY [Echinicola jeungdonensis]
MAIHFFSEDIDFNLPKKNLTKRWLREIAKNEGFQITDLNYIFCTDEYLHKINLDYLDHDTYTDIITFDNSESENIIEGDIFISIDRVKENANNQDQKFDTELNRVISHGLLHLCGYKDKNKEEAEMMREKENQSISYLTEITVDKENN